MQGSEEQVPDKNSSWGVIRGRRARYPLSIAPINQKSRDLWGKRGG